MKTPMEELIFYIGNNIYPYEIDSNANFVAKAKAKELLAKEKQVIIDAYTNGTTDVGDRNPDDKSWGEQYYNETFKNEEK